MGPDFLCIGAQKAGTTWLYRNLQRHRQVWLPPRKEVHYFDWRASEPKGAIALYRTRLFSDEASSRIWRHQVLRTPKRWSRWRSFDASLWETRYLFLPPNDERYLSLLSPPAGKISGDITPGYGPLPREKVSQVSRLLPDVKIVFLMRNPLERSYSAAVMETAKHTKGDATIFGGDSVAHLASETSRVHSLYSRILDNWCAFYPPERFFVGFIEDISFHPDELWADIGDFLEIKQVHAPPSSKRKIHSRSTGRMSTDVARKLAATYLEELKELSVRFGGYADFWLWCAQKILMLPEGHEDMPYPLHESPWWEEWANETGFDQESLSKPLSITKSFRQ